MTLLPLLVHHREALEYDLLPAPFDTDDILEDRVPYNKAWRVVSEILRDPYSHTTASVAGWGYVPNPVDVLFANWVDATAQMHHRPGTVAPTPVVRPWEQSRREPEKRTQDPGRDRRRNVLRERFSLSS